MTLHGTNHLGLWSNGIIFGSSSCSAWNLRFTEFSWKQLVTASCKLTPLADSSSCRGVLVGCKAIQAALDRWMEEILRVWCWNGKQNQSRASRQQNEAQQPLRTSWQRLREWSLDLNQQGEKHRWRWWVRKELIGWGWWEINQRRGAGLESRFSFWWKAKPNILREVRVTVWSLTRLHTKGFL